jgi:zinc protease
LAKLDGQKILELADHVPQERTYLVWPGPAYYHEDQASLDLASMVLSDGLSARLGRVLVYERQLCSNVSTFFDASEIAGAFVVIATLRPGITMEQVEAMVQKEFRRLAKGGPSAQELRRAKAKWEFDFISGLERIGGFGGKADRLNSYNTYLGDPGFTGVTLQRYQEVSVADVKRVVGQWIDTDDHLIVRFRPETSSKATVTVPDRAAAPSFGTDRPFKVPSISRAKLPNGLELFVVERPDLPKVVVSLNVRAGSVQDDPTKAGTAHLVVSTIDRGTKTRKALQIEEAFGNIGTSLGGAVGREFSSLSFDVLKKNLNAAMQLFADVVLHPTFPMEEFEREKKLHQDALRQEESSPSALAGRLRLLLAFGNDHPYGRPNRGLPSTVEKITRSDVVRYHQARWVPDGGALIMTGAISLAEAKRIARNSFGRWTGKHTAAKPVPEGRSPSAGGVFIAHRSDAAQTVVAQILRIPGRAMPDYYALRLADSVWGGGGFMTRLNLNLREDKGYSYGVFSGMTVMSSAGVWNSTGSVQTDKTKESVAELIQELKNLAGEKPITEEELQRAKSTRLRGYAQQFESIVRIAGQITELWIYGLPLDEFDRELKAIESLTLEEVNTAARRYAQPHDAALLLVGDQSKIEPQLKALGFERITVIDPEGRAI